MTDADLNRIERKLDLIIDALGLSKHPRLAPVQVAAMVKSDVLKFRAKRNMKNGHDSKES